MELTEAGIATAHSARHYLARLGEADDPRVRLPLEHTFAWSARDPRRHRASRDLSRGSIELSSIFGRGGTVSVSFAARTVTLPLERFGSDFAQAGITPREPPRHQ